MVLNPNDNNWHLSAYDAVTKKFSTEVYMFYKDKSGEAPHHTLPHRLLVRYD